MKKIEMKSCVTCTSGFHKGKQMPRPRCYQIEFGCGQWVQLCQECWKKLKKMVDGY